MKTLRELGARFGLGRQKRRLELVTALFLPVIYLLFVTTEHYGMWDRLRGLNAVKRVAENMNTSYAEVKRVFRPGDEGFEETFDLIKKYSTADLPADRKPMAIARHRAVLAGKADLGNGRIAEWTAPVTPLYVMYSELSVEASPPFRAADTIQVGTIGDLYVWIERSKNDFKFFVQDVFLALFSATLGWLIWKADSRLET